MASKNGKPLISVVMPVYNAAAYVGEAIESILNQTYQNFEFIIVDDASLDSSYKILSEFAKKDSRIKLFRNTHNIRSAKTVTKAIKAAKGAFLARMDADDIALPNRLELQLRHLLSHPQTVAVGGQCVLIDKNGHTIGEKHFPTSFASIYKYIYEFCPLQQPTLMIAKKRLPEPFDFYGHGMTPVEDIELLFKLFQYGKVENLKEYVFVYRIHGKNSSLLNFRKSFFLTLVSRIRGVLYYGYRPTPRGVLISIVQTFVVLLFPQIVTVTLYNMIKRIQSPTFSSPAYKPSLLSSVEQKA